MSFPEREALERGKWPYDFMAHMFLFKKKNKYTWMEAFHITVSAWYD